MRKTHRPPTTIVPAWLAAVCRVGAAAAVATLALGGALVAAPAAHAAVTNQQIGIPAYKSVTTPEGMEIYQRLAQNVPTLGTVIANVDSSPGTELNQDWATAIQTVHDAGPQVIGYVNTGFYGLTGQTTRSGESSIEAWTTQIHQDIDDWYAFYGSSGLDGIFFDQVHFQCGASNSIVDLYVAIKDYVKNNFPGAYVVLNPGVVPEQCYLAAGDTIIIFENVYGVYQSWTPPQWVLDHPDPDTFWHLVHATTSQSDMQNAVSLSKQRNAGYIYVTPDALPNPWDTLPPDAYWHDELVLASGVTDTAPPSPPGGLHTTSVGSTTVGLAWTRSTDNVAVAGYDIFDGSTLLDSVHANSATMTGLSPDTTYTFTVKARDAAGNPSAASAPLQVTTPPPDTQPPSTPGNLRVTSVTPTSVSLTWEASTDNVSVLAYDVYRNSTVVDSVPAGTTSATITGLTPASTFIYTVTARDTSENESGPSNPVTVTNPAPTSGPIHSYSACMDAADAEYVATFTQSYDWHHVFINSDNNSATGYQLPLPDPLGADYLIENGGLFQHNGGGWSWTQVNGVNPLVSSAGGTYTWQIPVSALGSGAADPQVIVFHGSGTSPDAYSQPVTVTETEDCGGSSPPPSDTEPPSPPGDLQVTSVTQTSVSLAWSAATDNVGVMAYDVYRNAALVDSVTGTTATVSGLTPASTYSYTVTARDAAGNVSGPSNPLTVTNPAPTSGPIVGYSACMDATDAEYVATFTQAFDFHRVFLNSDDNGATGYQLPAGDPLGADYLIEEATLFQHTGGGWSWSPVAGLDPLISVDQGTYTWQIPVSALGSGAADPQVIVFHSSGTSPEAYSQPVTVTGTTDC